MYFCIVPMFTFLSVQVVGIVHMWCSNTLLLELKNGHFVSHTGGGGEDVFGETYGPDSICLQHGRNWEKVITRDDGTRSTLSVRTYGGGCYEVYIRE